MEHRYSQRFNSDIKLMIYERGMPVSIGRGKNSSRYGFFVETDHPVYLHQPLEIEVINRQRRDSKAHRVKCFVVHSQSNGFGVEIHEDHINDFGATASTRSVAQMQATDSLMPAQTKLSSRV